MKKDRKKIKEPYEPGDTPQPPQIIDPNSGDESGHPVEEKRSSGTKGEKKTEEKAQRTHLLGDEAEIDDETTI